MKYTLKNIVFVTIFVLLMIIVIFLVYNKPFSVKEEVLLDTTLDVENILTPNLLETSEKVSFNGDEDVEDIMPVDDILTPELDEQNMKQEVEVLSENVEDMLTPVISGK